MTIGIFEIIVGTACLILAAIEALRVGRLRRRDENDLWTAVQTAHTAIGQLEKSGVAKQNLEIGKAYTTVTDLHRQILRMLAMREKRFTEETVQRWKDADKLNPWQESEARKLMEVAQK